jgi:hypothetical protein
MIRAAVLLLMCPCLVTQAFAYATVNARVTDVRVDKDGKGMVFFEQALGGSPTGCGAATRMLLVSTQLRQEGGASWPWR